MIRSDQATYAHDHRMETDTDPDVFDVAESISEILLNAIQASKVPKVVALSSIGAEVSTWTVRAPTPV